MYIARNVAAALSLVIGAAGAALAQSPAPGTILSGANQTPLAALRNVVLPTGEIAHGALGPELSAQAAAAAKNFSVCIPNCGTPPLVYNGGPVMLPYVATYPIFWAPASGKLQDGTATGYSSLYGAIHVLANAWAPGHMPLGVLTQYYQTASGTTTYINNGGGLGGYAIDTNEYPAAGCTDVNAYTNSGNCILDSQIRTEISTIMSQRGWQGGMTNIFVMYFSSGENFCTSAAGTTCSYRQWCAYHSWFTNAAGQKVIYAVIPYGNAWCFSSTETKPNNDVGDIQVSNLVHEVAESVTDPLLNAWYTTADGTGGEIGDLCDYNFGTPSWTNPATNVAATQMWNGWYFEAQSVWNNHTNSCTLAGP